MVRERYGLLGNHILIAPSFIIHESQISENIEKLALALPSIFPVRINKSGGLNLGEIHVRKVAKS